MEKNVKQNTKSYVKSKQEVNKMGMAEREEVVKDLMNLVRENVTGLTNTQLKNIEACCYQVLVG